MIHVKKVNLTYFRQLVLVTELVQNSNFDSIFSLLTFKEALIFSVYI